jgi:hypothetical protein
MMKKGADLWLKTTKGKNKLCRNPEPASSTPPQT